jgi:hypothetical protein
VPESSRALAESGQLFETTADRHLDAVDHEPNSPKAIAKR